MGFFSKQGSHFFPLIENKLTNHSLPSRPRLAVTLGDPAGIGPEVILQALADPSLTQTCDITIVGSRAFLVKTYLHLCQQTEYAQHLNQGQAQPLADPEQLSILDRGQAWQSEIKPGVANATSGAASFDFLEHAIARTLAGEFHGIVTGPIAKSAWKQAGHHYAGQTEFLAERAGVKRVGMLFVAESPHTRWVMRTLLATTHIPLRQVTEILTPELLSTKLDLLVECLRQDFGLEQPRIAIAGLNPHSGEQGQLGYEEVNWLIPWLEQERAQRPHLYLEGPVPPDTLWVRPGQAWYGNAGSHSGPMETITAHDAYLALYHDQGLIPVKLLAFDRAVNTTIGLPFIRTSPDHGTALDIVGKGIASATSMRAAIQLAKTLVQQRISVHNV
jgi:4-hydroxythreonine-4-phosphate dehydrogenase